LGRVPSSSHLYDQLVLSHVWLQLCLSLDLLLEMYVSLAMHKFCQAARECWDTGNNNRDLLEQTLARLERTVHGRLAEGSVSQRLRVNLEGVLRLLPLLKHSRYRLDQNGRWRPPACSSCPEENVRLAEKRARDRSLLDAHRAFWDGERNPATLETLPPYYHLTWYVFQIALSKVVPVDGVGGDGDDGEGREKFTKFVKGEIFGRGGASCPKADTWMKSAASAADRLYAVTVFFALWHRPTQSEPF
jgi:hypothetical protein